MSRDLPSSHRQAPPALYKRIPAWTIFVFCSAIAVAYSPNVLHVFSIHDDYNQLVWKSEGFFFFHIETPHLFADARPVAALLTNVPLLPVHSLADFRWVRIFSLLTVAVLGTQMIANCVVRLHVRPLDAVAVALATFFGLAFIYATMDESAWAPHLLTTFIAFSAYTILGGANLQLLPFLLLTTRRQWREIWRQLLAYSSSRNVWMACLVYQLAFYDYPPYALLLTVFPVIAVLFSQSPRAYRTLVVARDVFFIAVNIGIFSISTALIYLPIVRLFVPNNLNSQPGYAAYKFEYDTNFTKIFSRLGHLMTISGDLWFPPMDRVYILTGTILLLALIVAVGSDRLSHRNALAAKPQENPRSARLSLNALNRDGISILTVLITCYVMSASPVWGSIGGFVAYRTSVGPVALTATMFAFATRIIAETIWKAVGNPFSAAAKVADGAMILTACIAFSGSFYMNYSVMTLARNEFVYFTGIAQQAIRDKSKTIVLIDPRNKPLDISMLRDQQGRAAPSYEIGCFQSYCTPGRDSTIVRVAGAQFGLPFSWFTILVDAAGYPVPGLTCNMLTARAPNYPPNASKGSMEIIDHYRSLGPVTCVTLNTDWHDLGLDLSH